MGSTDGSNRIDAVVSFIPVQNLFYIKNRQVKSYALDKYFLCVYLGSKP
jgi:hypothetical protein